MSAADDIDHQHRKVTLTCHLNDNVKVEPVSNIMTGEWAKWWGTSIKGSYLQLSIKGISKGW